ncbi:MAG: WG repeat-containing protein, partial [Gracilibacteraceae bacterium]|nr:WG repeat-containing protein [Gracilibacteraceae bacterium]
MFEKNTEKTELVEQTLFCTQCGCRLKTGSRFCTACGAKAEASPLGYAAAGAANAGVPNPKKGFSRRAVILAAGAFIAVAAAVALLLIWRSASPNMIPSEYAEAEKYFTANLAKLESLSADADYIAFFRLSDELNENIIGVLQSELGEDPYPAGIIRLASEAQEKLYEINVEAGFAVTKALYAGGDYEGITRFFSSKMIDEANKTELVDIAFQAFAQAGDFARAETVIRELLNPYSMEALDSALEYQETLSDDYADWQASWERIGEAEYDRVMPFQNGRAKVAVNAGTEAEKKFLWGVIDENGVEIVAPQYDQIGAFLQDRAAVQKDGKWGFIDLNGDVVIALQFDDLKEVQDSNLYEFVKRDPEMIYRGFYENFAPVMKNGQWGYVDLNGKVLGRGFIYQDVWYFNEGIAAVKLNDKYGLINSAGNYIIEPNTVPRGGRNFDVIRPIYEGLAGVNWNGRSERGIIDKEGRLLVIFDNREVDLVQDFREGLASVRLYRNGVPKWGFIDRSGRVVIPQKYDTVTVFIDGIAKVTNGGDTGLINRNGEAVLPMVYEAIGDFVDDIAYVKRDGKYGFVKRNGTLLANPVYEAVSAFADGLACFCQQGKWGVMDSFGHVVVEPAFDNMKAYADGVAPAKINGQWGYVDASGYFVVPPQFDDAGVFSEGYAAVMLDGKYFYIGLVNSSSAMNGEVRDEDGLVLADALVEVYPRDDIRMYDAIFSTRTDEDGLFKLVLPEGRYKICVSKPSYLQSISYEDIAGGSGSNFAAQIVMIAQSGSAEASSATISVEDALTGQGVNSALVRFRRGYNNQDGGLVRLNDGAIMQTRTDGSGCFNVTLPYGLYTAEVNLDGYTTDYINFFVGERSSQMETKSKALTTVLPAGETRITLEWGERPADLDAHLIGQVPG